MFFRLTAPEVYDLLEAEDFFSANITMVPPNNGQNSDEDSDTEDGADGQHLSSNQLNAPAEFHIDYGTHTVDSLERETLSDEDDPASESSAAVNDSDNDSEFPADEELDSNSDSELSADEELGEDAENILQRKWLSSCVPPIIVNKWKQNDLKNNIFDDVPPPQPQETSSITPVPVFELFFDDEVIDFMVRMTNLYANKGETQLQNGLKRDASLHCNDTSDWVYSIVEEETVLGEFPRCAQ